MAKGNLFLGQARGKVGSVVFARAFGEQITRTRPTSVANPKTIGQNTQRAILATIAKSAAAMTSLVDHSFAGIAYGAESVRHFRKLNMGLLRNLYLNTQNGANLVAKGGSFVPNPLKVSEGNLPSFISIVDGDDIGFLQNAAQTLPSSGDIDVARFLQAFPYLQGGDQLTLVKITRINDGELMSGDAVFTMALDRIVFTPNAFDDLNAVIITEAEGTIGTQFLDLTKTTNAGSISLNTATGGLGFSSNGEVYYAALILSRKVNNVWQRSAQYLEQMNFDDYADNESAIASYGASASLDDATEYLNQAEESEAISGQSGPYMNSEKDVDGQSSSTLKIDAGSSDSENIAAAANTDFKISAEAFGTSDKRVMTVEIFDNNDQLVTHGAKRAWTYNHVSAETAGTWKTLALFSDGSKAICEYNVSVQAWLPVSVANEEVSVTLRGGSTVTAVMPVVTYSDGSKKILVNNQDSTWTDTAWEVPTELYIPFPEYDNCNGLNDLIASGDFDSSVAEEAMDMNGASTYPLMVPTYSMISCNLQETPNALLRMAFDGGYIESSLNVQDQGVTFEYANLQH